MKKLNLTFNVELNNEIAPAKIQTVMANLQIKAMEEFSNLGDYVLNTQFGSLGFKSEERTFIPVFSKPTVDVVNDKPRRKYHRRKKEEIKTFDVPLIKEKRQYNRSNDKKKVVA